MASQLLLALNYKLDNGANTCGIDFNFDNYSQEESSSSDDSSKSIIKCDEPRGDKYFELKVLEKLFTSEFNVVSEEGR